MAPLAALRDRFTARCSAEEHVLLACCRQDLDDPNRTRLQRALAQEPRFDVILATAVKHQVAPLVFENLRRANALDAVPADSQAGFQYALARNLAAKHAASVKLAQVLDEAHAFGFDVLLLKGASLDLRVWRQPWLTASADIDLLLRARWTDLTPHHKDRIRAWNTERPQIDAHAQRHPDLVMNGVLPVDFEGIWGRATPTGRDGRTVFLMTPEDELLAVCINACRKRYFRLKSLTATAELLHGCPALDWDAVAARASAWRIRAIVYTALLAAYASVGCPLPTDLRRLLRVPKTKAWMLQALIARMGFGTLPQIHQSRVVAGKHLSRWLLLQYASLGWRERLMSVPVVARQMRKQRG